MDKNLNTVRKIRLIAETFRFTDDERKCLFRVIRQIAKVEDCLSSQITHRMYDELSTAMEQITAITDKFNFSADEENTLFRLIRKQANKRVVSPGEVVHLMYENIAKTKTCKENVLSGAILDVYDCTDVSCFSSLGAFYDCHKKGILTKAAKRWLNKMTKRKMKESPTLVPI